jgi:hypothetical protein
MNFFAPILPAGARSWMKHWKHCFRQALIGEPRAQANPTCKILIDTFDFENSWLSQTGSK